MIDPDSINILTSNLPSNIEINDVPEFECEIYNMEDEKDYEKFISDCERLVRRSFEYKALLKYLRDNCGMNKCAYYKDITNAEDFSIKIEIHHYPFSLYDIVDAVTKKRKYYGEYISLEAVSKEVMLLHYRTMVGLIPLSETVHELFHNNKLFIPVDRVFGRYKLFVDYYSPFIDEKKLDALNRIEKYTAENSDILNTTILENNRIHYDIKDKQYALPDFNALSLSMNEQISLIKKNGYMLPSPQDVKDIKEIEKKEKPICPIIFFE
jgi:hypothetical protein